MLSPCPSLCPQLDVLDRTMMTLTAPAAETSEEQPQERAPSQGPGAWTEQLDIEETEQSKLPQYLERFQVSQRPQRII